MSSKKRRRKAAIARLIKLDANYVWLYVKTSPRRDAKRSWRLWLGCIVPLGDKLERQKPGAWRSLPRPKAGEDILMHNFRKRQN